VGFARVCALERITRQRVYSAKATLEAVRRGGFLSQGVYACPRKCVPAGSGLQVSWGHPVR
jgi:hypothetical protein